jgi:anaerobic dimethyl sulfoxide reductase subunit B (iron-sulfur subunit)
MQIGFYFDQSRCIGCFACIAGCRSWNQLDLQTPDLIQIVSQESGIFPKVSVLHLMFTCFHCSKPACIAVCPLDLIEKRAQDGIVIIHNADRCIGCQLCLDACPYDVLKLVERDEEKFRILKCNFCLDRLSESRPPACIASCPVEALDFGPRERLIAKYGELREVEGFPDYKKTNPSIIFKTKSFTK